MTQQQSSTGSAVAHTPTPWRLRYSEVREWSPEPRPERILGPSGDPIWVACVGMSSDPESVANAALIVKAVNSHDALVKALQLARARIEYLSGCLSAKHSKANEQYFYPVIDAALSQVQP